MILVALTLTPTVIKLILTIPQHGSELLHFSISTGIIPADGIASRFTLVPAGIGLLLISFLPAVVAFIGNIPALVIGVVLLYMVCSQIAADLIVTFGDKSFSFKGGLICGQHLPHLTGTHTGKRFCNRYVGDAFNGACCLQEKSI